MSGKITMAMAALFVVLAANVLQSTNGATYTVGDSTGWRVPANNDFYDDWADNKAFVVGDVLVFNFTTGQHDVAEVTETAYDACTTANTISTVSTGPARITLNRTGEFYFICTVPGHCSGGQKLNVDVRNGNNGTAAVPAPGPSPTTTPVATSPTTSTPPTAATPTSPGTSSPPPGTNSASSPVSNLSPVFFMAIALVLMC
ncbi:umecyanin-like [Gossypium raimondii]|uniref:umecyanin-like n=1 Tax=Gossypium raimondii TaxID=29730 RepID=UPI00063AA322|nr:umecyanin-like [Gossypium raimondii]